MHTDLCAKRTATKKAFQNADDTLLNFGEELTDKITVLSKMCHKNKDNKNPLTQQFQKGKRRNAVTPSLFNNSNPNVFERLTKNMPTRKMCIGAGDTEKKVEKVASVKNNLFGMIAGGNKPKEKEEESSFMANKHSLKEETFNVTLKQKAIAKKEMLEIKPIKKSANTLMKEEENNKFSKSRQFLAQFVPDAVRIAHAKNEIKTDLAKRIEEQTKNKEHMIGKTPMFKKRDLIKKIKGTIETQKGGDVPSKSLFQLPEKKPNAFPTPLIRKREEPIKRVMSKFLAAEKIEQIKPNTEETKGVAFRKLGAPISTINEEPEEERNFPHRRVTTKRIANLVHPLLQKSGGSQMSLIVNLIIITK